MLTKNIMKRWKNSGTFLLNKEWIYLYEIEIKL